MQLQIKKFDVNFFDVSKSMFSILARPLLSSSYKLKRNWWLLILKNISKNPIYYFVHVS